MPRSMACMAILIFLSLASISLSACSELPDSLPEFPPPQTATPVSPHSPEVTPPPVSTETTVIPATATPTPVPTIPPSASTIILQISIAPANVRPPYSRGDWRHWIDADDDCEDTRQEVLLSESTLGTEFKDSRKCEVATGSWTDPYTGEVFTNPRDLDIDHMVPLVNAHRSGGHAWDDQRKRDYANDLAYDGHLVAVSASANRSKGGKGPDEWRPPNGAYWCQYALDWITVKSEWELSATQKEADALSEMLDTCETRVYIQAVHRAEGDVGETSTPTADTHPAPTPLPTIIPTSVPILAPEVTPVQRFNCSDFDTWSEAQSFFEAEGGPNFDPHRLDRDGDGVACQSLSGAPSAQPDPTSTPAPVNLPEPLPDHNCSDFETWPEAQEFYEAQGGPDLDPHKLDRDGDGIACQSLPGVPGSAITPEPNGIETASLTMACSDFSTWNEAQAFFLSHGGPESDPYLLDVDGNGILCQSIVGAPAIPALPEIPVRDLDCSDFDTWSEAQAFYEEQGGPDSDPHNLDSDGDGIACQSLQGSPARVSESLQDRNCSDFDTWGEAQEFYEAEGGPSSDPHRLDKDGDGIACQSLKDAAELSIAKSTDSSRSNARDTHNCSDFDTWSEAQSFYESEGGPGSDPHRLDNDGDGIACQSLPGAPNSDSGSDTSSSPNATRTPKSKDTHNCSDFDTWSEAQRFYESEGGPASDPHRLDRDGDGVACQSLPGAPNGKSTPEPSPKPVPIPTPGPKNTHNCSDFDTWSEAQSFFESEGGPGSDPHKLDGNDDGIACQSLPGAPKTPTPTPASTGPAPTLTPESEDTHNCSDFSTWSEAQSFFESEGGPGSDPHKLDGNDDGIACQSLPGSPNKGPKPTPTAVPATQIPAVTSTPESKDTHNCSDFDTWSEAQAFFESEGGPGSDPHKLDGNDDGIACQSLPGSPKTPTPTPTATPTPTPAPTPSSG